MEEQKTEQPLSELIKAYIKGRRDDKVVKLLKDKPGKNGEGGINQKLNIKIEKVAKGNIELDNKLKEIIKLIKTKDEADLTFQLKRYDNLLSLAHECDSVDDIESVITEYDKKRREIDCEYDCNTWISWAAEKAEGVSLATHVIKLTHSGISINASCLYDKSTVQSNSCLTTANVYKPVIDGSCDAKLQPIVNFLQIKNMSGSLLDQILSNDYRVLEQFANSKEQLENWVSGLKKAIDKPKKNSHYLAKQVYFPVQDGEYHLLANVPSSSLAQDLFERFEKYRSEEAKEIRRCKDKNKYSTGLCTSYPDKARLSVTASPKAHLNVSKLNKERNGIISLLSCKPPVWQSRLKSPVNKSSLFYTEVHYWSRDTVQKLQRLLLAVKINGLSVNNPKVHAHFSAMVEEIIEFLFQYVTSIHNLENQSGWSRDAKRLKLSHQLWLDPFREDEEFQQKRNTMEWQVDICRDFSLWLNSSLKHKQLTLGKPQETFFQKIMRPRLRAFNAITEVTR